jgi:hypothetical protein
VTVGLFGLNSLLLRSQRSDYDAISSLTSRYVTDRRIRVDSGPSGQTRQRRRGANTGGDQLHSITSAARARSDGGMLTPSALAVLRLITRETSSPAADVGYGAGMSGR